MGLNEEQLKQQSGMHLTASKCIYMYIHVFAYKRAVPNAWVQYTLLYHNYMPITNRSLSSKQKYFGLIAYLGCTALKLHVCTYTCTYIQYTQSLWEPHDQWWPQ